MPLIGTAGHVDHGKSTLIQTLTGRDPDRWAEEKRRGLTIDLGFAWTDLGNGKEVSFVDVPGHEKYLKNMLAGVEAIEVALLVVAANEGWMPQSEEHLAILDLLDIGTGAVAVTKIDIVDADIVQLAVLEVEDKLVGTALEGASIIPVSATAGTGIDRLRAALLRLTTALPESAGRARMWVDRAFTVAGTGTVVTGSLLGSSLQVGQQIEIYPSGKISRIRSIQTHEQDTESVEPGRRVALGLVGVAVDEIDRGAMIGGVDEWRTTNRFSATLRHARYVDEMPERGAYQLHIGSGTHNARLLRVGEGRALIAVDDLVPLAMGDHFVIRDTGRRLVVAGGRVLDPFPGSTNAAMDRAVHLDASELPDDRATQLLAVRGYDTSENLARDTDGGVTNSGVQAAEYFLTDQTMAGVVARTEDWVRSEHEDRPLRAGLPLATLVERLALPLAIVEEALERTERLELRGPDVAEKTHQPRLPGELSASWRLVQEQLESNLAVPSVREIGLPPEAIHLLIREGELIRVSDDLVFLPGQIAQILETVATLEPPFGVGAVKEALGLSRKHTMPILEWLDSNGYTIRRGDSRVFARPLTDSDR